MTPDTGELDADTRDRIAAGGVIERRSPVVRDLLENALDAGAARVEAVVDRLGDRARHPSTTDTTSPARAPSRNCSRRSTTARTPGPVRTAGRRSSNCRGRRSPVAPGATTRTTVVGVTDRGWGR